MEYRRFIRNRQIERAKKLLPKKGPNDVTRFIKKTSTTQAKEKVS